MSMATITNTLKLGCHQKEVNPYPIRLITNEDIGLYIDDLIEEGKALRAFKQNILEH